MLITIKEKIEVNENYLMPKLDPDPFAGLDLDRILLFGMLGNDFQIGTGFLITKISKPFFEAEMFTDEMEPTIKNGDIVTVDTSDRKYVGGEIYALFTENGVGNYVSFVIRRLFYDEDSHIAILKKDDVGGDDYDYEALRCDDLNEIILGRVRLSTELEKEF